MTNDYNSSKDNRKVVYGVLIAALIGTWGYIFYDKSQTHEQVVQLETKINNIDSARMAIQQDFMVVSLKADSLTKDNLQLQGELAEKNADIQKLKGNISSILKKKNATADELAAAKSMIEELNGKIEGLFAEVGKLKEENTQLTNTNNVLTTEKTALTAEKQGLEKSLSSTSAEKKLLEDKVDVASTLHASGIAINALKIKNSGKEKETTSAKRANLIRISFVIDQNRITPTGVKDIFVVVSDASGSIISEGGKFDTREEGTKAYTSKVSVNYEQNKVIPVSFDWKKADSFKEGNYKIEIYNNGFKIGQGVKTLK